MMDNRTLQSTTTLSAIAVDAAGGTTERRAALEEARGIASADVGTTAARSQDFLYDEAGLPA